MTRVIFDRRGTIDKYVGDMIMAFWGAPLRDAEHAEHAVAAALDMLRALTELRAEFAREGLPEIAIGIGINSGLMNVGDMGSHYRRAYTVIGDAVNLASRLEGLTKYYGVDLVVGPRTRELAPGFVYRRLDRVRVKGKREAVEVFAPLCRAQELGDNPARGAGHARTGAGTLLATRMAAGAGHVHGTADGASTIRSVCIVSGAHRTTARACIAGRLGRRL